jgi:2'-hydroxyisoflavone reductase
MRLLVLGGTKFVGRSLVEVALADGHAVTLFHRGETGRDLFPDLEHVLGDRDGGLDALGQRDWDAVIDVCGYLPRVVGASARRLADRTGRYVFVSTVSVYADFHTPGMTEDAPLATLTDPNVEVIAENYGGLKVACERAVLETYGSRCGIARPGLIVGPYDLTDRFGYWVRRIAAGGEVLCPDSPDRPLQVVDARDLAAFLLKMAAGLSGTFNTTSPTYTLGDAFEAMRDRSRSNATFTWVPERLLLEDKVEPWSELPLWTEAADAAIHRIDSRRAFAAGLVNRPLTATIRATLAWESTRTPEDRHTLTPEREAALLAKHHGG